MEQLQRLREEAKRAQEAEQEKEQAETQQGEGEEESKENTLGYTLLMKADYDFAARSKREMSFKKGDVITVLEKDDSGWWRGKLANGTTGLFPSNYTTTLEIQPKLRMKLSSKVSSRVLALQQECGFTPRSERVAERKREPVTRKESIVELQKQLNSQKGFAAIAQGQRVGLQRQTSVSRWILMFSFVDTGQAAGHTHESSSHPWQVQQAWQTSIQEDAQGAKWPTTTTTTSCCQEKHPSKAGAEKQLAITSR